MKKKKKNKGKIIVIFFLILLGIMYKERYVIYDFNNYLRGSIVSKVVNYENITNLREEALEKDLSDMQKLLNLNTNMANYKLINSTIIDRNSFNWLDSISIDKGKNDGIETGMAVINDRGLIGKVKTVYNNSSKIVLLSSNDDNFKIPVNINDNINGIVNGYNKDEDLLIVECIRKSDSVKVGDIVKTNGLSNIIPEGILVGYVTDIEVDKLGITQIVKVQSSVDFYDLKYVSVLDK